MSVLIVDDSETVRKRILASLSGFAGLRVVGEASGKREGLQLFQQFRPDVVILDIQMPDGSGLEVLEQIRELDRTCMVIMFSSYKPELYEAACLKLGADHYFHKFSGFDRLLDVLGARMRR